LIKTARDGKSRENGRKGREPKLKKERRLQREVMIHHCPGGWKSFKELPSLNSQGSQTP
jgi:hypothetical protein